VSELFDNRKSARLMMVGGLWGPQQDIRIDVAWGHAGVIRPRQPVRVPLAAGTWGDGSPVRWSLVV